QDSAHERKPWIEYPVRRSDAGGRSRMETGQREKPDPAAPAPPEPEWEVARLFPPRGAWSEEEYLLLPTNRLVEFSEGALEVLPMPGQSHQLLVLFFYRLLSSWVEARSLGLVLLAPFPVRLWPGKFREPDVLF